ncbi:hypothetical protein AWH60_11025 [Pseudoalteromonas haloplanktis]|nr:hypothetical protein AWH60_11025 [Pseudoalteromonas haloplanktis]
MNGGQVLHFAFYEMSGTGLSFCLYVISGKKQDLTPIATGGWQHIGFKGSIPVYSKTYDLVDALSDSGDSFSGWLDFAAGAADAATFSLSSDYTSSNPYVNPESRLYYLGMAAGGVGLKKAVTKKVATKFEKKIEKQMGKRGWDKDSVNSTIDNPNKTVSTRDTSWNSDGTRRDDPATAYFREDGHYVVRNNNDGTIVQISNRNKADWKSPFE